MNMNSVICPNCGATLKCNADCDRVTCDFCGGLVIVEDSKQKGYNEEKGKMKAREDAHKELADRVDRLIEPYCNINKVNELYSNLQTAIKSARKKYKFRSEHRTILPFVWPVLIAILSLIILVAADANLVAFLIMFILCDGCFLAARYIFEKNLQTLHDATLDQEKRANELFSVKHKYEKIIEEEECLRIPEKYRNQRALEFIRDTIASRQAETIPHAIALYETLLRQEEQIKLQKEQIELTKQQMQQMKEMQNSGYGPHNSDFDDFKEGAADLTKLAAGAAVAGIVWNLIRKH